MSRVFSAEYAIISRLYISLCNKNEQLHLVSTKIPDYFLLENSFEYLCDAFNVHLRTNWKNIMNECI